MKKSNKVLMILLSSVLAAGPVCSTAVFSIQAAEVKKLSDDYDPARLAEGAQGFYKWLGDPLSQKAVKELHRGTYYRRHAGKTTYYVDGSDPNDPTYLYNMKVALEMLMQGNDLRESAGLSRLPVNSLAMAGEQVQVAVAAQVPEHPQIYTPGENLSWGTDDPYKDWYFAEKKRYDATEGGWEAKWNVAGHYMNIISTDNFCTGYAYTPAGSRLAPTHGQLFCNMFFTPYGESFSEFPYDYVPVSDENELKAYSMSDKAYYAKFMEYYNAVGGPTQEADYFEKHSLSNVSWHQNGSKWSCTTQNGLQIKDTIAAIDGKKYWFDQDGYLKYGWYSDSKRYMYFDQSGTAKTGWLNLSGAWYHFDADGNMSADKWIKDHGKYYYLSGSGDMLSSQFIYDGNNTYYLDASGGMKIGWGKIDGWWYYFNDQGIMQKNKSVEGCWLDENGRWTDGGHSASNSGTSSGSGDQMTDQDWEDFWNWWFS